MKCSLADRVGDKGADLVGGQGELCVGIITEEGIFQFNHQFSIILCSLKYVHIICIHYFWGEYHKLSTASIEMTMTMPA